MVKHGGIGRYISEYVKNLRASPRLEIITLESDISLPDEIKISIVNCERDVRFMSMKENKRFSEFVKKLMPNYRFIHSHGVYDFLPDLYTAHICLNSYFEEFDKFFGISRLRIA